MSLEEPEVGEIRLRVEEVTRPAERIASVLLAPADGTPLPPYTPGAHVEVHLPDGGTRPYSLIDFAGDCSAPEAYRLATRLEEESRGGSAYMHALGPGDAVTVSPPKNDFHLSDGPAPAVLLAGGIGITPLVSMATARQRAGLPYRLHYAVRNAAAAAFADALAAQHGAAFHLHRDDDASRLDLPGLIAALPDGAHLYVCGPRGMIEAAREGALTAGLPHERIHFELFAQHEAQTGDAPFEVEIASTGRVFTIPPGKSIIEVLEAEGMDLIHDCQRGDCGICQTTVLAGEPDHRDVVLSEAERASGKVMQICVSRAKSARLTLDL